MARTKGSKNKGKGAPIIETGDDSSDAHVKIVSTDGVTDPSKKELLDQIAKLQKQNAALKGKVETTEQERDALAEVQGQGTVFQTGVQEKLIVGKTVKVTRCAGYKITGYKDDGREILRAKWKQVELPVYLLKIDMPACGDIALKINGIPFYHGGVYEFDLDTLRTVKDLVARTWDHDANISGNKNENAYRRKHEHFDPRNILRGTA